VRLVYRDLPTTAPGPPVVVLHDRGAPTTDQVAALAQTTGAAGRVVAPFGDYGFTASGMELAGICWYRTGPGFASPDPLSLARAVVQVGDLLDALGLDAPVLVGWGQGAAVGLGTGLLHADRVASVIGIDAASAHVDALPAHLLAVDRKPPVLLLRTRGDVGIADEATMGAHGFAVTEWRWPGGVDQEGDHQKGDHQERDHQERDHQERDKAVAEQIGRWLADG
jgi:pimeloyl-ACP methyl ester carboxylesterase